MCQRDHYLVLEHARSVFEKTFPKIVISIIRHFLHSDTWQPFYGNYRTNLHLLLNYKILVIATDRRNIAIKIL